MHVRTTPAGLMPTPLSVFEYVHRDHLGSVEAVTNEAGEELVVLGHDPYGERRDNDWTARLTEAEIETLLGAHGERVSRGFTGHEHLDRTGLIHMNGRVYDPRLGRFLSPDPIVGDPTSSQSWNLYSYVGNNPLSYADPTGESGQPIEEIVVTASRCDWVCGEDMYYWMEWWYWSNGSWIYYTSWQGYSYSDEITRSIVEQALEALKALDQSVADQPADTTIEPKGRKAGLVYVTGHKYGGGGPYHLAVEYTDPVTGLPTTLSAEKIDGDLKSDVNRPSDWPEKNELIALVIPPDGVSPGDFFDRLKDLDDAYCDCYDYDVFPGMLPGEGYNSNSYAVGLIEAGGGTVHLLDYSGTDDPLPVRAFQGERP